MRIETTWDDFYRNTPTKSDYIPEERVQEEINRCTHGVYVDNVYFSGWLYWHLNFWHIRKDRKDTTGNVIRVRELPDLRDNEWIREEHYIKCKASSLGYIEVGLRQGGKSEFVASKIAYFATIFRDSQNIIVGGNDPDLAAIKDKIDTGFSLLPKWLAIPKLDKDWRKSFVRLGYKSKSGEDVVWSYILVRNAVKGTNTEVTAGPTAMSFVIDEIGKFSFGETLEAGKYTLISEYGWRAIPILVGTGGSFTTSSDAERYYYNPEANGFLPVEDPETGRRTGLFMSGIYRIDCKEIMRLSDWLKQTNRIPEDAHTPELDKIEIKVANKEKAIKIINEERERKKKDPDQTEYLKTIMYMPLTPEECFMTKAFNFYPAEACAMQKAKVINEEPARVELVQDGKNVVHRFSDKNPITSFPSKPSDDKDAPILIWEFPDPKAPAGTYVAGIDSYRQGTAEYSTSLGVVYIFKRMTHLGCTYANSFVACYAARPNKKEYWDEQALLLLRFYNAIALCENDELSFIDYVRQKGYSHLLQKEPHFTKDIAPTSMIHREYGVSRANSDIRNYLRTTLKSYLQEEITVGTDENGNSITALGVTRIKDPMLLEELIKYDPSDKKANYDREVAASLAVAQAKLMDYMYGTLYTDEYTETLKKIYRKKTQFGRRLFTPNTKKTLFRDLWQ
jgi:hypothetical protein